MHFEGTNGGRVGNHEPSNSWARGYSTDREQQASAEYVNMPVIVAAEHVAYDVPHSSAMQHVV